MYEGNELIKMYVMWEFVFLATVYTCAMWNYRAFGSSTVRGNSQILTSNYPTEQI